MQGKKDPALFFFFFFTNLRLHTLPCLQTHAKQGLAKSFAASKNQGGLWMNLCASLLCLLFLAGLGKSSADFLLCLCFSKIYYYCGKREGVKGRRGHVMLHMARNSLGALWGAEWRQLFLYLKDFGVQCPGCVLRRSNTRFPAAESLPSHVWHWELGTRAGRVQINSPMTPWLCTTPITAWPKLSS